MCCCAAAAAAVSTAAVVNIFALVSNCFQYQCCYYYFQMMNYYCYYGLVMSVADQKLRCRVTIVAAAVADSDNQPTYCYCYYAGYCWCCCHCKHLQQCHWPTAEMLAMTFLASDDVLAFSCHCRTLALVMVDYCWAMLPPIVLMMLMMYLNDVGLMV